MAKELWQQYDHLLNDFIDLFSHGGVRQPHEELIFESPTLNDSITLKQPVVLTPHEVAVFTHDSQGLFEETLAHEVLIPQGYGVPWSGYGALKPQVMVITLAPQAEAVWLAPEADDYLTKWLQAIHIDRGQCYHTSFFRLAEKSTTVRNRAFIKVCYELIIRQIRWVQPQAVLICGAETARHLMQQEKLSMASLRAAYFDVEGCPLVVTHDPNAVLKNQNYRREVWQDLTRLAQQLPE